MSKKIRNIVSKFFNANCHTNTKNLYNENRFSFDSKWLLIYTFAFSFENCDVKRSVSLKQIINQ